MRSKAASPAGGRLRSYGCATWSAGFPAPQCYDPWRGNAGAPRHHKNKNLKLRRWGIRNKTPAGRSINCSSKRAGTSVTSTKPTSRPTAAWPYASFRYPARAIPKKNFARTPEIRRSRPWRYTRYTAARRTIRSELEYA